MSPAALEHAVKKACDGKALSKTDRMALRGAASVIRWQADELREARARARGAKVVTVPVRIITRKAEPKFLLTDYKLVRSRRG
jgi:hypothetical protein